MPAVREVPVNLKVYVFHGMELDYREGSDTQAKGDCPFCGKEGKFHANIATGLWDCKSCATNGNPLTFVRQLWEVSDEATTDYDDLAESRKLLFPETAMRWGGCRSVLTGEWLLPGYSPEGKISQLYRFIRDITSKRMKLLASPGLGHYLHGVNLYDANKPLVYITEGPWDGMALWETLRTSKHGDRGLVPTSSETVSLLAKASVISSPGANVFFDNWASLCAGKNVVLMYDSDKPVVHKATGKELAPVGFEAMKRISGILASATEPPDAIHFLEWGKDGYDPNRPSGFDVRDWLTQEKEGSKRSRLLDELLKKVRPIPEDWVKGRTSKSASSGGTEIECLPCTEWKELVNYCRRAMKWIDGLDRAFSVMLAVVVSTECPGDQLWVKIVSPPSSGKSILCEALSVNRKYIYPKDTVTGMFSGFAVDKDASEDMSLAARLKNKTLVIKDGDTLLQAPNRAQILSQLRALYDRAVRTSYGNKASRDYEDHSTTVILCGTKSLRKIDTSELGERFLDVVIVDKMEQELEEEINHRKANDAFLALKLFGSSNGKKVSEAEEMLKMKQLTGGYVNYLKENAKALVGALEVSPEALQVCESLGTFVSFMRSRPSGRSDEDSAQREMSFRLTSQLTRLMCCLTIVLNKKEPDSEVLRRVIATGLDTARGRPLLIARLLFPHGERGLEMHELSTALETQNSKMKPWLDHMKQIGALKKFVFVNRETGQKSRPRWKLTPRLRMLYREVYSVK